MISTAARKKYFNSIEKMLQEREEKVSNKSIARKKLKAHEEEKHWYPYQRKE